MAGEGPLAGRRILVTRRPEQARSLLQGLQQRGAEVVLVPLISVVAPEDPGPLDRALDQLARFDWIVFTSANTVEAVCDRLEARGLPVGLPQGTRIAVVGPSTASAVEAQFPGAVVALQPASQFRAEGLLDAFRDTDLRGLRILLPLSDRARDILTAGLRGRGADVDSPIAYRTLGAEGAKDALQKALAAGLDFVTLASPSAVDAFVAAAGPGLSTVAAAVIGPITERAARQAGLDVRVVASPSTVEGLLTALVETAERPSP